MGLTLTYPAIVPRGVSPWVSFCYAAWPSSDGQGLRIIDADTGIVYFDGDVIRGRGGCGGFGSPPRGFALPASDHDHRVRIRSEVRTGSLTRPLPEQTIITRVAGDGTGPKPWRTAETGAAAWAASGVVILHPDREFDTLQPMLSIELHFRELPDSASACLAGQVEVRCREQLVAAFDLRPNASAGLTADEHATYSGAWQRIEAEAAVVQAVEKDLSNPAAWSARFVPVEEMWWSVPPNNPVLATPFDIPCSVRG